MKNWTLTSSFQRVGIPTLVMFVGFTIFQIVRREVGESVSDIVTSNGLLFAAIWVVVAFVLWIVVPKVR